MRAVAYNEELAKRVRVILANRTDIPQSFAAPTSLRARERGQALPHH